LYYELYIDSLFLVDFVMNFYLLNLTGKIQRRTVTCLRCIVGAAYGSTIYCVVFIMPAFSMPVKIFVGSVISIIGMAFFTFNCKSIRHLIKVIPSMAIVMLIMGGIFFVLTEKSVFGALFRADLPGVVAVGIVIYGICNIIVAKIRKMPQMVCSVKLETDMGKIEVNALIDTGNLLIEPISKKPVSVLDENSMRALFGGELPEYYRVVPYTSVGRKHGLLKCFEIPRILVDVQEEEKIYEKVLVACSEEFSSDDNYMILNPRLFNKEE